MVSIIDYYGFPAIFFSVDEVGIFTLCCWSSPTVHRAPPLSLAAPATGSVGDVPPRGGVRHILGLPAVGSRTLGEWLKLVSPNQTCIVLLVADSQHLGGY